MTITIQTVPLCDFHVVASPEAIAELAELEQSATIAEPIAEAGEVIKDEEPAVEASQEATTAEPIDADKERFEKERELLKVISEQIKAKLQAEIEMVAIQSQLKIAKENYKLEVARCERLEGELLDLLEGKVFPESAPTEGEQATSDATLADESDTSWRLITTKEVCEGINGLGAKKLESLIDAAPTLGDLVDLQAQAYNGDFRKQLPEGFGVKIAEKIENAIEAAVIRFQQAGQKSAAEQAKENQPADEPTAEVAVEQPSEPQPEVAAAPVEIVDDAEWTMHKSDVDAFIVEAREEFSDPDYDVESLTYTADDADSVHEETISGYQKFQNSKSKNSIYEFPKNFIAEQIQRWVDGWVSAERRQQLIIDSVTL